MGSKDYREKNQTKQKTFPEHLLQLENECFQVQGSFLFLGDRYNQIIYSHLCDTFLLHAVCTHRQR